MIQSDTYCQLMHKKYSALLNHHEASFQSCDKMSSHSRCNKSHQKITPRKFLVKFWSKNPYKLLVELWFSIAVLKTLQKVKTKTTIWDYNPIPGMHTENSMLERHLNLISPLLPIAELWKWFSFPSIEIW